jgi:polyphosphate kinase
LRPGILGLSDNIRVRSVIGRFLEHNRIFHFKSSDSVYLASADWMDRNFFRRIELGFPILDKKLKRRVIKEGLQTYLADNVQAWEMKSGGNYQKKRKSARTIRHCAQTELIEALKPGGA